MPPLCLPIPFISTSVDSGYPLQAMQAKGMSGTLNRSPQPRICDHLHLQRAAASNLRSDGPSIPSSFMFHIAHLFAAKILLITTPYLLIVARSIL
ncbi:hypothetical protein BJX70DRAFT_352409 [Aspergillus crustosus]